MMVDVKEEDRGAILAIFDSLGKSWNEHNGQAFGQCFTVDTDYVIVKKKGDWKIAAFHNCRIQPPILFKNGL